MSGSSLLGVWISTGNSATGDHDAFSAQQLGLTLVVAGLQRAAGTDDAPPGEAFRLAEDVADGSGGPGKSRFFGDFTVCHHISGLQGMEYPKDFVLEPGHRVPKSRSPMSPRPGRM
jgi:hypothetical protein